eukprot:gene15106-17863_t
MIRGGAEGGAISQVLKLSLLPNAVSRLTKADASLSLKVDLGRAIIVGDKYETVDNVTTAMSKCKWTSLDETNNDYRLYPIFRKMGCDCRAMQSYKPNVTEMNKMIDQAAQHFTVLEHMWVNLPERELPKELFDNRYLQTLVLNRPRHLINWETPNPYPLPDNIRNLGRLQTLSLYGQGYSYLPQGIRKANELDSLILGASHFSEARTREPPAPMQHRERGVICSMTGMGASWLRSMACHCEAVLEADTEMADVVERWGPFSSGRCDQQIPEQARDLTLLVMLAINLNPIDGLSDWLLELQHMKYFYISHTEIRALPDWFYRWQLHSLYWLSAGTQTLPSNIGDGKLAETLVDMWLPANALQDLPLGITYFTKLNSFRADLNPLCYSIAGLDPRVALLIEEMQACGCGGT